MRSNTLARIAFAPELTQPGRKPVGAVAVDWSRSITRGMIRCIAFQGGAPFDLVQQQFLTAVGSGHFDTVRLGGLGHRHGASNGSMCYTFPVTTEARNSFSVAWHGEMHSGTTIGLRDTTVAGGTVLLWRNSGFDQRVGGTDYSAGGTWNLDQPTRIVHTSGASAARLYADGNLIINGGAPGATALVSPWALHRNGSVSNAQGCVATDYLLALWDRPLEPDEAYEWMRDPYGALLRPVGVFVPKAGAVAPPTFIPSWAASRSGIIGAGAR